MSLGVDLVPHKVCSLNCIYCEAGMTTELSLERKEYFPAQQIKAELADFLKNDPRLDFITFSGAGEPTLNTAIGDVIAFLQENYPQYKIAILTNASLIWQKDVRDQIVKADVILPSLDAVSDDVFQKINRPVKGVEIKNIISGLIELRKMFKGLIWLEIFIIPGLNNTPEELRLFKTALQRIKPNKVQLNTLDRPGTELWVSAAKNDILREISDFLNPLPVEIIARTFAENEPCKKVIDLESRIIETIRRRPCTADDMAKILGISLSEAEGFLNKLQDEDKIKSEKGERGFFFRVK
jgi:wyosine [tRNA(Phe)-imidazoG37] synthetase (radical SAM superfamily)